MSSLPISALQERFPATQVIHIDPNNINEDLLQQKVIPILKRGEPVAFPTETVYGIGANANDASAVHKIFKAKGRPSDNPLIVHISNYEQLSTLIKPDAIPQPGSLTHTLCQTFWPGPLTILFPKNDAVPDNVTAGQPRIGIRMPAHPIALKIIQLSNLPLAAPSANLSGRPSPTCAEHVLKDLGRAEPPPAEDTDDILFGKGIGVECIVDGGSCDVGIESTVVSVEDFHVLRPGGVTLEQLQQIDSRFSLFPSLRKPSDHQTDQISAESQKEFFERPSTPGVKYVHYSPVAPVTLVEFDPDIQNFQTKIAKFLDSQISSNQNIRIGILRNHPQISYQKYLDNPRISIHDLGTTDQLDLIARNLFAAFRILDETSVDLILLEGVSEAHEGLAIMNRARKAATTVI